MKYLEHEKHTKYKQDQAEDERIGSEGSTE